MMKRNHNPNQGDLFSKTASTCPFAAAAARVRNDVENDDSDWPIAKAVADMEQKARFVSENDAETTETAQETQKEAASRIAAAVSRKAEIVAERKTEKKRRAPGAGRKTLDHGGNDSATIRRPISIPAALWHTIQVCSESQGITASEYIRRAVSKELGGVIA